MLFGACAGVVVSWGDLNLTFPALHTLAGIPEAVVLGGA